MKVEMTPQEWEAYHKEAMEGGTLSDAENPCFILSGKETKLVYLIAEGRMNMVNLANRELEGRGITPPEPKQIEYYQAESQKLGQNFFKKLNSYYAPQVKRLCNACGEGYGLSLDYWNSTEVAIRDKDSTALRTIHVQFLFDVLEELGYHTYFAPVPSNPDRYYLSIKVVRRMTVAEVQSIKKNHIRKPYKTPLDLVEISPSRYEIQREVRIEGQWHKENGRAILLELCLDEMKRDY